MTYDYKNKAVNVRQLNNYMYAKTLSMFEYQGLPPSIPVRELERLLQIGGYAFITEAPNGKLYAFHGGLGGVPCPYGNPTEIVIANPALNFYKTLKIKTDGVLIRSDDMALGLDPLFYKCNMLLAENDINMILHGYSTRMQKLISASDDKTKESATSYLKKVIDGEVSIVAENALFDGVKIHGTSGDSVGVTGMVEYHQYVKSLMLSEIGLSTSFNMKKERMITAEVDQQDDSTFPFVYNMMKCRLHGVERINEMYGTNIEVDFGSVWNLKNKQLVDDIIGNNEDELSTIDGEIDNELVQLDNDDTTDDDLIDRELAELETLSSALDKPLEDEVEDVELDKLIDEIVDEDEELFEKEIDDGLAELDPTKTEDEDDEPEPEPETSVTDTEDTKRDIQETELDKDDEDEQNAVVEDIVDDSGTDNEQSQEEVVAVEVIDTVIDVLESIKTSTNDEIEEISDSLNTSKDKDNATT